MQFDTVFHTFSTLPSPVLTVYVNTAGKDASRHPRVRTDLAWLLDSAETLLRTLVYADAKRCERQVNRVRRFLEERHPAEKALVIFSGVKTWQVLPLQVPLTNELQWGKPKIAPLLPLLRGHRRYAVVAMDQKAARFFEFANSEVLLLGTKQFEIDASQWKRKDHGRVATERVLNSRGPLRDVYEHHIEARYKQLCHEISEEIASLSKKNKFDGVFLVGPDRLIQAVREKIPRPLVGSSVLVQENFGGSSPRQLQRRLQPIVDSYEQEQQLSAVKLLQASNQAAVTNPDEVLAHLQNGRISSLVVARDFDLALRQCPRCGLASSVADRVCADCGVERQEITLAELLARVLPTQGVTIEFVNGDAAQLLLHSGGLGGWLRVGRSAAAG